jgi:hypothetical protein
MDDITEPHDGQVTHELHGEWNTFHPGVHTPSAREALNWTRLRANKTKTWDETKKRWA